MQTEVTAFLGDPATHGGAPVTRIDTHAAIVFLSGSRALKIKRCVKLPFLDLSTLDRRKAGCELELAVNEPYAPTIYRRVIPITREPDGRLALDGNGEPVEWALDMLRFDEGATLDRLAARGEMSLTLASDVADVIACSHATATVSRDGRWVRSIPAIIQQNADAFRSSRTFTIDASDEIERLSRRAYTEKLPIIEHRTEAGFVRRCHGDLHLANIALIEGKPVLFDALEFDETLATIDVLHDLSFALMDLIYHGCTDAANVMFNRYLDRTPHQNLGALGLLPLFMSMRAAVRANVLLCRPAQRAGEPSPIEAAGTYFAQARSLLQPPAPCLIAVGGLSGTGKTAVARALAPLVGALPGAVVLRSDILRKRMLGVAELDRLAPSAYRSDLSAAVYAHLAAEADTIVRQGHSVIVDAVFAQEAERSAIELVAKQAAVPFTGLFLTADLTTRVERIKQRSGDASDATAAVAEAQETYELGSIGWDRVDAAGSLQQTTGLCADRLPRTCVRPLAVRHG